MEKIKLICLPQAGGNANAYYSWKKYIDNVEVLPMEYAGHGKRFDEEFYDSYENAIKDIYEFIKKSCNFENYILFGHSMGAHFAYELYYYIKSKNQLLPKHIFFSGSVPPYIQKRSHLGLLPDFLLLRYIINLGGVPKEILKNKPMLNIAKKNLIRDFRLLGLYKYKEKDDLIECKVSIFMGKGDKLSLSSIKQWQSCVKEKINIVEFEGDHFFIKQNESLVLDAIKRALS